MLCADLPGEQAVRWANVVSCLTSALRVWLTRPNMWQQPWSWKEWAAVRDHPAQGVLTTQVCKPSLAQLIQQISLDPARRL